MGEQSADPHKQTAMGGCTCGWTPAPNPTTGWGDWSSHIGSVCASGKPTLPPPTETSTSTSTTGDAQ